MHTYIGRKAERDTRGLESRTEGNIMKMLIGLMILLAGNAFALPCGNKLINPGASIHEVKQYCVPYTSYTAENVVADNVTLYYTTGGKEHILVFIDGVLSTIDGQSR